MFATDDTRRQTFLVTCQKLETTVPPDDAMLTQLDEDIKTSQEFIELSQL